MYSSEFNVAVAEVLRHEGGYNDTPNDRGGETNFGISARNHPDVDIKNLTREQAIEIYYEKYWLPNNFDSIAYANMTLAVAVFVATVNMSAKRAIGMLQGILGLNPDGKWGPRSRAAMLGFNMGARPQIIVDVYATRVVQYYFKLADGDPSQRDFLLSWLRRVYG